MDNDLITKEKISTHPMEDILGIEPNTTVVEYQESDPTVIVQPAEYDEKDIEVEEQFQEIYDKAIDAFDIQADIAETLEGKYVARNNEVAVQMLTVALNAAKEKSALKKHKDKLDVAKVKAGTPGTLNQNLIMDRNDILKLLHEKDKK